MQIIFDNLVKSFPGIIAKIKTQTNLMSTDSYNTKDCFAPLAMTIFSIF